MKEHLKRREFYSEGLLPSEGTAEHKAIADKMNEEIRSNPSLKKELAEKMNKAYQTMSAQIMNGIGLNMDSELRYFLQEYNNRSWSYGHRSMPMSFNILEAFFNLDKNINSWKLLEEEDYLLSMFDFIDFYTSSEIESLENKIEDNLEEETIYNYNVGADIDELTFKSINKNEYIISGISLIRRGDEVNILFQIGQIIDTTKVSIDSLDLEKFKRAPNKEKIEIDKDRKREAVPLNNDLNKWKTLAACRFNLTDNTINARYVLRDLGNSFEVYTDDITGFLTNGEWTSPEYEKTYLESLLNIETFSPIFELAKAALYLPSYFNNFESSITEEEHDTKLKKYLSNPILKKDFKKVDLKYKIRNRQLWLLNRNGKFDSDRVILRDDQFVINNSGYWKDLKSSEIGTNKKGKQITGKTWVNKTESYYHADSDELIISRKSENKKFEGKDAGYIYVMRNPTLPNNVFKIGKTTKETKDRTKQLSNTSVPEKFYKMRDWMVKNCHLAEKEIHEKLNQFRIDPRREFFELDMVIANNCIEEVVNRINNEYPPMIGV